MTTKRGREGRSLKDISALTHEEFARDPDGFKAMAIPHMIVPAVRGVVDACAGTGPFMVGGALDENGFRYELEQQFPELAERVLALIEKHTSPPRPGKPQRWAVRIAMEVARWTGQTSETSVILKIVQDYGLRDEAQIRERLDMASKVSTLNLDEAVERATDLLVRVSDADPRRLPPVLARLTRGHSHAELEVDDA